MMMVEAQLGSDYLRLQADRCRQLSQSCMDLGVAGDLREMSEEYFASAANMKARESGRAATEASYYVHRFLDH